MRSKLLGPFGVSAVVVGGLLTSACGYDVERLGRVVDAQTSQGIVGIRVRCVPSIDDTDTTSGTQGRFSLYYDDPCRTLECTDIDGAENGVYEPSSIPFPPGEDEIVVQLTPAMLAPQH